MATITLEVSDEALANVKKIVEDSGPFVVTDPLAFLTAQLQLDAGECFETYAYMIAEGDGLYEGEVPGLKQTEDAEDE